MDLRVLLTAFTTLFLAEMGDKTQLAVLTLTASTRQPLAVFVGAGCALLVVTALGALVGEAVGRVVPAWLVHKAAAVAFMTIGVVMLLGKGT